MQKVEGSNPFSRSRNPASERDFVVLGAAPFRCDHLILTRNGARLVLAEHALRASYGSDPR